MLKPIVKKTLIFISILFMFSSCFKIVVTEEAKRIHNEATVIDLHNDTLQFVRRLGYDLSKRHIPPIWYNPLRLSHIDIPRIQEGGVDALVFALWAPPTSSKGRFKSTMKTYDAMVRVLNENPETIELARTTKDIEAINEKGKIAAILAVEGGYILENKIENFYQLYDIGIRYIGISWNNNITMFLTSRRNDPSFTGLGDFYKKLIPIMEEKGVIVDVAHSYEKTFWDIMEITNKPVIASHAGVWELSGYFRMLKDDEIKAIANKGGVIGIIFSPWCLKKHGVFTDLNVLIDHIDYIVKLVGVDHVALGSDFDGGYWPPRGMKDISDMPKITQLLLDRGYSEVDIKKILGGNFLRVFKEVCG